MKNDISTKLKKYMKDNSCTQKEIANKVGISESTVSYYLTGKRYPGFNILKKFQKTLKIQFI